MLTPFHLAAKYDMAENLKLLIEKESAGPEFSTINSMLHKKFSPYLSRSKWETMFSGYSKS